MTTRDLHSNIKVVSLIDAVVVNNDSEGTPANGLDTKGFASAELIANIGTSGDGLSSSPEVSIKVTLEDSDDDATYAAVTDSGYVLVGSNSNAAAPDSNGVVATLDSASEDNATVRVGYVGPKRYVRMRLDVTGTHTNGTPCSILGLLGHPSQAPTSD